MTDLQKLRITILFAVMVLLLAIGLKGEADVSKFEKFEMLYTVAVIHHAKMGSGSAVVIFSHKEANYSLLLTAGHVVKGAEPGDLTVMLFPDKKERGAAIMKVSDKYDLALVRVDHYHEYVAECDINYTPRVFDEIWRVGAALDSVPFPSEGLVSRNGDMMFSVTNDVFFGDSGGGIFRISNNQLKLVGIIIGIQMWQKGFPVSHMNYIYNMEVINDFLKN